MIEGEDALSKVHSIKSETRKLYARTFFANCLHAPKNEEEYNRDISFIYEGKMHQFKPTLNYDTSKFFKFSQLKNTDFLNCANEVFNFVAKNDVLILPKEKENYHEKYLLYLHNDNIHDLVYVAAAIYEFIPNLSLTEAYLTCICAEIKGSALLMGSESRDKLEKIHNSLVKCGLIVSLTEGGNLRVWLLFLNFDGTLYSNKNPLKNVIDQRTYEFLRIKGIEDIESLEQKIPNILETLDYFCLDREEFINFVYSDLAYDYLKKDQILVTLLKKIPCPKILISLAPSKHLLTAMERLEISYFFDEIISICENKKEYIIVF